MLLRMTCINRIPLGAGLGSSAAAIVGGLVGANAWLDNPLSREELLAMATELEGHPDNVAPALMGGLALSALVDGQVVARKIDVADNLHVTIVTPEFHLPTKQARAALPAQVGRAEAVYNISRAALVVEALKDGDFALLAQVMDDRLHQPYRLPLIPGAGEALEAARRLGVAAALSGAGPSLVAFGDAKRSRGAGEEMRRAFEKAGLAARLFELRVSAAGAVIQ
jgi:homoserine kinase